MYSGILIQYHAFSGKYLKVRVFYIELPCLVYGHYPVTNINLFFMPKIYSQPT